MRVIILGTRGFPHVQGGAEKHSEQLSINLVRIGESIYPSRPLVLVHLWPRAAKRERLFLHRSDVWLRRVWGWIVTSRFHPSNFWVSGL